MVEKYCSRQEAMRKVFFHMLIQQASYVHEYLWSKPGLTLASLQYKILEASHPLSYRALYQNSRPLASLLSFLRLSREKIRQNRNKKQKALCYEFAQRLLIQFLYQQYISQGHLYSCFLLCFRDQTLIYLFCCYSIFCSYLHTKWAMPRNIIIYLYQHVLFSFITLLFHQFGFAFNLTFVPSTISADKQV